MLISEFNTPDSTIRFHDDWVEPVTQGRMAQLSRIVSESYRRRAQDGPDGAAAALGPGGGPAEV